MEDSSIRKAIFEDKNAGLTLRLISGQTQRNKSPEFAALLEDAENDYRLMCSYMLKGYKDPQADKVYDGILKKAYRLYKSLQLDTLMTKSMACSYASNNARKVSLEYEGIQKRLEGFVQDIAMASLGNETSKKQIYATHQQYIDSLFDAILVSGQWSDDTYRHMADLLLSPTVDTIDACTVTSAIMMASMNVFDINKWLTLVQIYRNTNDTQLKQRALVGWVFALSEDDMTIFPDATQTIAEMCSDADTRRQLLELQIQMVYCNNADADSDEIRREIIPTLIKNNNLKMTRSGIIEKEDDPMRDILDPGSADRDMEELEKSMQRMMDMQKSGVDIYFGGFSQMKRFAFFNTMSNWFCPFYTEHPELPQSKGDLTQSRFMQFIFSNGPFCNSDKYSFALAMAEVIDRLPANMKEMLGNNEAFGPTMPQEETKSPAYIRRMYLQDLYRFFRLYHYRQEFRNPFVYTDSAHTAMFFTDRVFERETMKEEIVSLEKFLYKRKQYSTLIAVATSHDGCYESEEMLLLASSYLRTANYPKAKTIFEEAVKAMPDNPQALKGLANSSFMLKEYDEATRHYATLAAIDPSNRNYSLNYGISLVCSGKTDDGMNIFFKLYYEHPDDANIKRALAWGYLFKGKADEAEKIYDQLITSDNHIAADYINCGYAKWFLSKTKDSVAQLRRYIAIRKSSESDFDISCDFNDDKRLLQLYAIPHAEINIMLDLLSRKCDF